MVKLLALLRGRHVEEVGLMRGIARGCAGGGERCMVRENAGERVCVLQMREQEKRYVVRGKRVCG